MYLPDESFGAKSANRKPCEFDVPLAGVLLEGVAARGGAAAAGRVRAACLALVLASLRRAASARRRIRGMMALRTAAEVRSIASIPVTVGLPCGSVSTVCARNFTKKPRAPLADNKIMPPSWFGPFSR